MLAFPNVMNFLAHEFSRLRRRRFPLTRILSRSFYGFLVGHDKFFSFSFLYSFLSKV